VSDRRVGPILSLLRQGITLGVDFGAHSLESLLAVAETVEGSVYRPDSLVRTASGLEFVLDNPPLRSGAFSSLTVSVDGVRVPPERARVRRGEGFPWRSLADVSETSPVELLPGVPTQIAADAEFPGPGRTVTVRLELRSVAIPPLVWFEFSEVLRDGGTA
jgi:hypothetical protein